MIIEDPLFVEDFGESLNHSFFVEVIFLTFLTSCNSVNNFIGIGEQFTVRIFEVSGSLLNWKRNLGLQEVLWISSYYPQVGQQSKAFGYDHIIPIMWPHNLYNGLDSSSLSNHLRSLLWLYQSIKRVYSSHDNLTQ